MGEPLPISSGIILQWQALHGHRLEPWELNLVLDLDGLWFAARPKPKSSKKQ